MPEPIANEDALAAQLASVYAGRGDPVAMLGEFRRTPVLVPLVEGGLLAAESRGVRWLLAFSGEAELAAYARARGSTGEGWEYVTAYGARLLDVAVPACGVPAGVALDVGSAQGMVFPPAVGVVPDAVAVMATGEVS